MQGLPSEGDSTIEPHETLGGVPISEMLEILRLITRVEPLDVLLGRVAETISKRFAIKALTICIKDDETGFFRPRVVHGFPEDQTRAIRGHAYPLERKMDELEEKFRIGDNCYFVRVEGLTHIYNDDADYLPDIAELPRIRESEDEWHDLDYIVFVMTDRLGNWIGWIEIEEPFARRIPSRETIAKIQVFSGLTAIAIENSKVYDDAIRAVGESQGYLDLIVHDIGNLIDPLIFYLESLDRSQRSSKDTTSQLTKAMSLARETKNLIDNARGMSRIKASDSLPENRYDLREVLVKCISSVKKDHPTRDIVVGFDCPYSKCFVKADDLIFDLFSNIMGYSVRGGGRMAELDVSISDGHSAWTVRIEDRGNGRSEDERKLALPGQGSNHGAGRGSSGLGFSVVNLLVDRYNGLIIVRDRIDGEYVKGACYEVALPKHHDEPGDAA